MYVVFENVLGAESASRGEVVVPVMSVRWRHCCEMVKRAFFVICIWCR